ncbi:MAG: sigma-70 family RNA polymerase sigma factor [Acidobacteriota bacterium]
MTASREPSDPNDEDLMLAYQAGDRGAFDQLYYRYARPIYNFFRRSAGRPDRAEDLCQKTFLKLHIARQRYRPEAPFRHWIFTIARNVLRDDARERRRRPAIEVASAEEQAPPAPRSNRCETMDVGLMITEALGTLPLSQREVLVLNRYQGMNYAEIGAILGISENAAKQRAFQGMQTLRRRLRGMDDVRHDVS